MAKKQTPKGKRRKNLWLPDELVARAEEIAVRDRRKPGEVLRLAVEEGLAKLEERLGVARPLHPPPRR
jgi:hypothetical protein